MDVHPGSVYFFLCVCGKKMASILFFFGFLTIKLLEYIMQSGLIVPKTICFMRCIINVSSALKRFSYALQNVIALMVLFNSAIPKVPK